VHFCRRPWSSRSARTSTLTTVFIDASASEDGISLPVQLMFNSFLIRKAFSSVTRIALGRQAEAEAEATILTGSLMAASQSAWTATSATVSLPFDDRANRRAVAHRDDTFPFCGFAFVRLPLPVCVYSCVRRRERERVMADN